MRNDDRSLRVRLQENTRGVKFWVETRVFDFSFKSQKLEFFYYNMVYICVSYMGLEFGPS